MQGIAVEWVNVNRCALRNFRAEGNQLFFAATSFCLARFCCVAHNKKTKTMFTVEQIKEAHLKVKSGADFPVYIREIKALGVTAFETWTVDSHTVYFGKDGYQVKSNPMYDDLPVNDKTDKEAFSHRLKIHQQGKTDYFVFCKDCAQTGVEKWLVNLDAMTCAYYDKEGNEMLIEQIPG